MCLVDLSTGMDIKETREQQTCVSYLDVSIGRQNDGKQQTRETISVNFPSLMYLEPYRLVSSSEEELDDLVHFVKVSVKCAVSLETNLGIRVIQYKASLSYLANKMTLPNTMTRMNMLRFAMTCTQNYFQC